MRLYKLVNAKWSDPWGETTHVWRITAVREVTMTALTIEIDDGYGKYQARVWIDSHGRLYEDRTDRISYSPTSFYVEQGDSKSFWTARPTGKVLDLYGNPWRK